MKHTVFSLFFLLLLTACSAVTSSNRDFSSISDDPIKITIFTLYNYTDTPQAGMRAANIAEGVLIARGDTVVNAIEKKELALEREIEIAKKNGSDYLLTGGVSEWRYKTGIDGEPAVSLQLKLIDVQSREVVWSATGSDSSWGNSSIGTTAQALIESMIN